MALELFATLALQRVLDRLDLAFSNCDLAFFVSAHGGGHRYPNEEDADGVAGRRFILGLRHCREVLLFLDQLIPELLAALPLIYSHRDIDGHDRIRTLSAG